MYAALESHPNFRAVRASLRRTTAPVIQPVSLDEVKRALDMDGECDGELERQLTDYLSDAVDQVEIHSERSLMSATWKLYLDQFPEEIELRRPPVTAVSSVVYVDDAGDSQTLSASLYQTDLVGAPGRIQPAYGEVWPQVRCQLNAVTVTFVAGAATRSDVPRAARHAILIAIRQMYYGCDLSEAYWQAINDLRWAGGV